MTQLTLLRRWQSPTDTCGRLLVVGRPALRLFTLEDAFRPKGVKIDKRTCIAAGEYPIELTVSGRAKRGTLWTPWPDSLLPELKGVPGFDAVRLHALNRDAETDGCIGVGFRIAVNGVEGEPMSAWVSDLELWESRKALEALVPIIRPDEPCRILIVNGATLQPVEGS